MAVWVQEGRVADGLDLCGLELHVRAPQLPHLPSTRHDALRGGRLTRSPEACVEGMVQVSQSRLQAGACSDLQSTSARGLFGCTSMQSRAWYQAQR